ncbi:MAG TPA: hypothetical protein VF756_04985 [Thermoanaerobaculia bacterium]
MRAYALHGLHLAVSGWQDAVEALHGRLAGLPHGPLDNLVPDLTFEIEAVAGAGLERPERSRPVYDPPHGEVLYDDERDLLYIELGAGLRALCEPGRGRARLVSLGGEAEDLWTLSHPLFTLPFVELLKRRGLYHVHAAGLALKGRGLVLPGTSGSGKSTLAVALARAGFGFLGDDALFLAKRRGGVGILAFPDEVDLTDQTVAFFPELAPLLDSPPRGGWRKRQIRAEETYGAEVVWECEPALLVFPRVSGREASKLTPIGEDEALFELAPNVLLTEPASSQAHLDALAELASASRCYRLETGRNLEGAARMLRDLMDGTSS